jgi:UDP-N-acetylmuramoyl-tripeptide--D-alanyl-D-alanine ligase
MNALAISELARLELGELRVAPGASEATGLQIDSRCVEAGDLFVAAGASGAVYVSDALAQGAAAALIPDDEHAALAALGRHARAGLRARVLGITGSVGKTTTKDILAAFCAPHLETVAAQDSYNNELGVPLTLGRADAQTELVICELGMRGLGQVAELCEIAQPHVGVITSIGPAHLETVGSLEHVAQGKAELLAALPADGVAIAPVEVALLAPYLAETAARVLTVGAGGDVEVISVNQRGALSEVEVAVEDSRHRVEFNVVGKHNVENALTAIAAYHALGLPLEGLGVGARDVALSPLRSEEIELDGGGLLLNDSYNANPLSMAAAIEHLAEQAGPRRRVVVLGAMAELGDSAGGYHHEIGTLLARTDVDVLIGIGELATHYRDGLVEAGGTASIELLATTDEAIAALRACLEPGDCVLVKASRAVGLEVVAAAVESIVA